MTTFRPTKEAEDEVYNRVDEWLKSLADAMSLSFDFLNDDSGSQPEVPDWVRAVNRRLDETLYSPVHDALDELKLTPYRLGYALGLIEWGSRQAEIKSDELLSVRLPRMRISTRLRRRLGNRFESFLVEVGFHKPHSKSAYIPQKAKFCIRRIEIGPTEDASAFHQGKMDGLKGVGRGSLNDKTDQATDIYFLLVMSWRFVSRMQSVTELHEFLIRFLGAARVGERKRVEKICERMGIRFRARGRPRKSDSIDIG